MKINFSKQRIILAGTIASIITALILLIVLGGNDIKIDNNTGLLGKFDTVNCEHPKSRPVAVMLSSDPEARPLSGISQADIVFEMPVTPNGVTRVMAVYQCIHPLEIGSIRSARLDFIPLVRGLDALYAHWGGEHEALQLLNSAVTDNIDGLKYDGTVYYRKKNIPRPHNGFVSYNDLIDKARDLNYEISSSRINIEFEQSQVLSNNTPAIHIDPPVLYAGEFAIDWTYSTSSNSYERVRGNKSELDANTNKIVAVQNVVVLKTTWSPINPDYIRVSMIGSGPLTLYKNGESFTGTWLKENQTSPLEFLDQNNKPFIFTEGKIWVHIIL
jgi:hypothetical protein